MSRGHIRQLRSRLIAQNNQTGSFLIKHSSTVVPGKQRKFIKKNKHTGQPTSKKKNHKIHQQSICSPSPLQTCLSFQTQSQLYDSKIQVASIDNSDINLEPLLQGYSSLLEFSSSSNRPNDGSSIDQVWTYMGTIGEHLIRQESLFPIPPLCYNDDFGPIQRLYCMKLISCFCNKLNFRPETHFLAANIFHRICTALSFSKYNNSLKASCCLFIAAKYQQITIPRVQVFCYIDNYCKLESASILDLQSRIVIYLGFNLSFTSPLHFVDLLAVKYKLDASTRDRAINLSKRSLVSEQLSLSRGSLLALTCIQKLVPIICICAEVSDEVQREVEWRLREMTRLGLC